MCAASTRDLTSRVSAARQSALRARSARPSRYRDSSKHLLESPEPGSIEVLLQRNTMVRNVKVRRMGGSVGATLPKEMAERLHLEAGDEVLAVETADGILLSPYNPEVEEALAIAAEAQKRYQGALRELAK